MGTNIDPVGAPEPTEPQTPAFDPTPWQEAGIISRDPHEVAARLQLADAFHNPDQRDQVISRILSSGEQPILPPNLTLDEAGNVLREYAQMREQGLIDQGGGGYQQPETGYYDEAPQPEFDLNQFAGLIGTVMDQRLQQWEQQRAQQAANQQREQVIADAVGQVVEQNRFPDGIAQSIHAEARQMLAQNPLATPQQAAAAAAGRWQQQLAQYLQQAPPAPPAPPAGTPLPDGGVPAEAPRTISEARDRMIRAAGQ